MGNVTQAIKKRLSKGIVRRSEIIRLIERGINTAYSIAKAMDLDPGTVKHHLDWLEKKGVVESKIVVEKGRAKKIFQTCLPHKGFGEGYGNPRFGRYRCQRS